MGNIKELETERLILRKLEESDAEEMFKNWANDDEVTKFVRWYTHKNVDETREYIKFENEQCKNDNYYNWGIVLKETGELIGAIGAFPSEDERTEPGYNISKKYWNNGYTTEALKKVLEYLTNEVGIHRFRCSHAVLNPASGKVMQKAGFKYIKNEEYEKFDGSAKFECKVYILDVDKYEI